MKKLIRLRSIVLTILLSISFDSDVLAFLDEGSYTEFNTSEISNLMGCSYKLYFFRLTLAGYFRSSIIEFSETGNTFSLTLYGKDDQDGTTYPDCPYEESDSCNALFKGQSPQGIVGVGFNITGISLGSQYVIGNFRFFISSNPPEMHLYLFWGGNIKPSPT